MYVSSARFNHGQILIETSTHSFPQFTVVVRSIPSIHPHTKAGWWRFSDVLHSHDGKADCSDVLYIFSVRMSVYRDVESSRKALRKGVSFFPFLYSYKVALKWTCKNMLDSHYLWQLWMQKHRYRGIDFSVYFVRGLRDLFELLSIRYKDAVIHYINTFEYKFFLKLLCVWVKDSCLCWADQIKSNIEGKLHSQKNPKEVQESLLLIHYKKQALHLSMFFILLQRRKDLGHFP